MDTHLVLITWNRLPLTKLTLESVLQNPDETFRLTIWDNASTDGTVEFLREYVTDPRIDQIVFSKENVGQIEAVNTIWSRTDADLLGKLDNDCILPRGWIRAFSKAHEDVQELGAVACWPFLEDEFDYERARWKIHEFNGHRIVRQAWPNGTGLIFKRKTFLEMGKMDKRRGATSSYWLRLAAAGYINGYYYPLYVQDHMDDPMSPNSEIKCAADFEAAKNDRVTLQTHQFKDFQELVAFRNRQLAMAHDAPYEPKYYMGWRRLIKRAKERVRGAMRRAF